MLRRGQAFNGYSIEAMDGKVGTVSDFLVDERTWKLRWLVVDTGSWLTGRKILLHPMSLEKPDLELRAFPAKLTRAQVEASPDIALDMPVSMQMDAELSGYYGWEGTGVLSYGTPGVRMPVVARDGPAGVGSSDPHLRSMAEVTNYSIRALDGGIGHLESFLIEDEDWTIRYLVVNTSNWWHGRHVLIAPVAVKEIDWSQRYIGLGLTCYKIKGSPPWERTGMIDQDYERLMQTYYGWDAAGQQAEQVSP
jgi:hypothetical protein